MPSKEEQEIQSIIEKNNITIKYLEYQDDTITICKKCLWMYGRGCTCYDCNDPEEMIGIKIQVFIDHLNNKLI